jgi:hypothetical protein
LTKKEPSNAMIVGVVEIFSLRKCQTPAMIVGVVEIFSLRKCQTPGDLWKNKSSIFLNLEEIQNCIQNI